MIARIWRGCTRSGDAREYGAFLERKGFADYRGTPGNRGALLLERHAEGTAEFLLISFWDDFDAVRRFAGPDPDKAIYYPEDEHYLLGKEPRVTHYELAAEFAPEAGRVRPEGISKGL
jgi:heme-degrading monooxygenase HmoA